MVWLNNSEKWVQTSILGGCGWHDSLWTTDPSRPTPSAQVKSCLGQHMIKRKNYKHACVPETRVPFPNSSMIQRERDVACWSIRLRDRRSLQKVDCWSLLASFMAARVRILAATNTGGKTLKTGEVIKQRHLSVKPILALAAGTKHPACAKKTMMATWGGKLSNSGTHQWCGIMQVDLPHKQTDLFHVHTLARCIWACYDSDPPCCEQRPTPYFHELTNRCHWGTLDRKSGIVLPKHCNVRGWYLSCQRFRYRLAQKCPPPALATGACGWKSQAETQTLVIEAFCVHDTFDNAVMRALPTFLDVSQWCLQ